MTFEGCDILKIHIFADNTNIFVIGGNLMEMLNMIAMIKYGKNVQK